MAIRKSSRSRADRAPSAERILVLSSRRHGQTVGAALAARVSITSLDGLRQVAEVARRLRAIHGTAVAAQGVLRHQAAEQDVEIADCLRVGVCDPIADQIRALDEITERCRRRDRAAGSSLESAHVTSSHKST